MAKNDQWMFNVLSAAGKKSDSDPGFSGEATFGGWHIHIKMPRAFRDFGRLVKETGSDLAHGKVLRAVHAVGRASVHSNEVIGRNLERVPVVGKGLHAIYTISTAPFDITARLAHGERVDKAMMRTLKDQAKAYKDIAPYVQMVISNVPGIGQGVSAAIGAGLALAEGRPITEAVLAAAKAAVPGGPLAAAAFSTAVAGIQGKPIDQIALSALPIDDSQKKLLGTVVNSAKALAKGERVDEVAMHAAMDQLPPEARKAAQVGIALAQGQKLQNVAKAGLESAMPAMLALGEQQAKENPVFQAGAKIMAHDSDLTKGFHTGLGFMQHKVTPTELVHVRSLLNPKQLKGFEMAASAKIGQVAKPLPASVPPAQRFGYYVLHGLHGNKPEINASIAKTIARHPDVKKGALAAAAEVQVTNRPTWIHRVLQALHIEKKKTVAA